MEPTSDTSTLKKNPAYLEFPADILNNEIFMQMSMSQRGIYWTMRMYCWKNGTVPAAIPELAKLLRENTNSLYRLMGDGKIDKFFSYTEDLQRLFSPDLEAYRQELIERKNRRIENGRKAAEKKWRDKNDSNAKTHEMAPDMYRTDLDDDMNSYLIRSLN